MKKGVDNLQKETICSIMKCWSTKERCEFITSLLRDQHELTIYEQQLQTLRVKNTWRSIADFVCMKLKDTIACDSARGDFMLKYASLTSTGTITGQTTIIFVLEKIYCDDTGDCFVNQIVVEVDGAESVLVEHQFVNLFTDSLVTQSAKKDIPDYGQMSCESCPTSEIWKFEEEECTMDVFNFLYQLIYPLCKKYGQSNVLKDYIAKLK